MSRGVDDRKQRRYIAYVLGLIAAVFLLIYVPWKDSSGEDPGRQGFLGYGWRSDRPHGIRHIQRSVAEILNPLSLTKFQRAQVQAILAGKSGADFNEVLRDPLSSEDENDLTEIEFDGTENFVFDEEQFDQTGMLPPFSQQLHQVSRDMLLAYAHPDYFIIALEEAGVFIVMTLWVVWIQVSGKPSPAAQSSDGVKFDFGGFDFAGYDAARKAKGTDSQLAPEKDSK